MVSVLLQFRGEKFRNFIQVNNTESNGYRYNTDYKIKNIWYQNQFDIENGNVKFQAGIQEKKSSEPMVLCFASFQRSI